MFSFRKLWPAVVATLVFSLALPLPTAAQDIPDFTFIHATDVHAPSYTGAKVMSELGKVGEIELTPYGITVGPPSFVVDSGDITEFGAGEGWEAYLSYWKDVKIPVYTVLGNHDGPWSWVRGPLRKYQGCSYWSFDKFGCHFIGLDTCSPQDPRATVSREQLLWLEKDLRKVAPETPVFLVMHHRLNDTYFGSPYAVAQFMDMLRPYNLVAVLFGHGHHANNQHLLGVDNVQGGAVSGPVYKKCIPGFSIVSIKDGMFRAAYKPLGEATATTAVLEKPMPLRSSYPKIEILSPREKGTRKSGTMILRARISGSEKPIVKATWMADRMSFKDDDVGEHPMELGSGEYWSEIPYSEWTPGAHYIRVTFTDEAGRKYQKSVSFYTEPEPSRLVWRTVLGGSVKGTPAATKDAVYVGATDCKLYALDKSNGKVRWSFATEGDIASQPLVEGNTVYVGSGDGKLYAVGTDGKQKWTFEAKEGIFCSPVFADGLVLFGSNDSSLYAVDARTGKLRWVCEEPAYTVESKPCVVGDTVYFGAWDTYVYAVDLKTGQLKWKCVGHGSNVRPGLEKYYSPADSNLLFSEGKVFAADRDYYLNAIDASTGTMARSQEKCTGVGLSEDGKALYLRGDMETKLRKTDLDGNEIWSVPAATDSLQTGPVEKDGIVYVISGLGLVQAFKASDGAELWKYRATPMLYVLSEPEVADGVVYVSGMDGTVTAVKAK